MKIPTVNIQKIKPGDQIAFKITQYDAMGCGIQVTEIAEVIRIITDPLNRHEPKCLVNINSQKYGIHLSEVLKIN
jgi:hypothetical protein